jgi:hypothetical protein
LEHGNQRALQRGRQERRRDVGDFRGERQIGTERPTHQRHQPGETGGGSLEPAESIGHLVVRRRHRQPEQRAQRPTDRRVGRDREVGLGIHPDRRQLGCVGELLGQPRLAGACISAQHHGRTPTFASRLFQFEQATELVTAPDQRNLVERGRAGRRTAARPDRAHDRARDRLRLALDHDRIELHGLDRYTYAIEQFPGRQ